MYIRQTPKHGHFLKTQLGFGIRLQYRDSELDGIEGTGFSAKVERY
jgi:hypothetical protein